jgi:hypothetical protein
MLGGILLPGPINQKGLADYALEPVYFNQEFDLLTKAF